MAESKEELKSVLKVEEESEKVGLKLNIQKTKIMASGPITSWQIHGETMETDDCPQCGREHINKIKPLKILGIFPYYLWQKVKRN